MNHQLLGFALARLMRAGRTPVCVCAAILLTTSAFAERIDGYSVWQWNGFSQTSAPSLPVGTGESVLPEAVSSALASSQSQSQASSQAASFATLPSGTAVLSGVVFYDVNHNSVRDGADWAIPDARVELTIAGYDEKVYAVTSPHGAYTFSNLPAGTYTVTLVSPNSETDMAVVGTMLKGDDVVPSTGAIAGVDTIANIALGSDYVASDFDFEVAYPAYLLSKRMLLNTDPGIHHPSAVPEPGTLRLVAIVGLSLIGLLKQRRKRAA
ncbi:MAG: carboxypeptidase regulatory-like domain-containing protein [Planctomycetaceae bacterium]|nr:carboxypeptidase regulatory-like domain-containing protein [Planctomycetaceae bacterium]